MSHHLDTPLASQNGQLYIDDLYVFLGDGSTVFVMDVNSNITGARRAAGLPHEARYEFKVHFDGAAFEALTYRVSFDEPDADGRQSLRLHALTGDKAREDRARRTPSRRPDRRDQPPESASRIWAGRIADSFYIDLSLLNIVNAAVKNGTRSTCRHGARRTRATASPTRPSNRSCLRSPTSIRSCDPARASASGVPPSSPQTRVAGGRSTAPDTP